MEEVKANISIGELSIQLEGTREFVEKYLDQYQAIIEKGYTLTPTPHKPAKEKDVEKPASKRTRTTKSKAGPTCTEKVQELVNESYFKEPRTRGDVQEELLNRGTRYPSNEISAVLNNFFRGNKILKTGVGKNAKFYTNV